MKKLLILLVFMPISALAQVTASYSYGVKVLDAGGQTHQNNFSLSNKVKDYLALEAAVISDTNDKTRSITNRYEVATNFNQPFYDYFAATLRTAVGEKQKSGMQPFPYYSAEVGVNADLTHGFSARVAYRYRAAFNPNNHDTSNTMRYSLGYKVTEKDKITLGYDVMKGDGANGLTYVKYSRTF